MAVCVCAEVPGLRFINPPLLFLHNFYQIQKCSGGEKKPKKRPSSETILALAKYHVMIHCDGADKPNESIYSFRYLVSEPPTPTPRLY